MRRENHEVTTDDLNNIDDVNNTDDVIKTERILLPLSEDTDDYDPHKHRNRANPTS